MNGAPGRRRAAASVVLATVLVGTLASTAAPATHRAPLTGDLDLVASANPSAAEPVVADDAYADVVSYRRTVDSDVTATGSATCDGCAATSTALQVLYVGHGREARLDNTAVAWTQACAGCTAAALSVQVVVLRGLPAIVPSNRALAVTAACASCGATGVAFQVVVSSWSARRLSADALSSVRAWVDGQAAALRTPAPPPSGPAPARRARRTADAALGVLEQLVTTDLGATPVSADVDLRNG
jgi:hypothetical protein